MSVTLTRKITKKIAVGKTPDGKVKKEVKRGKYSLTLASVDEFQLTGKGESRFKPTKFASDALESAIAQCDGDESLVARWYDLGRMYHARTFFANMLAGTDSDLKKLIAQFGENVAAIAEYTETDIAVVREKLLAKPQYEAVKAYFDSFATGGEAVFTEDQLEQPKWFSGEEDSEDEDDNESETDEAEA